MDGDLLTGCLANVGAVTRQGDLVERPAPGHAPALHRLFAGLREKGFDGAPLGRGLDVSGRERLEFIPGDVPILPYPGVALTDTALRSVGRLVRRFHDASAQLPVDRSAPWPTDLADPSGGPIVGHNNICLENVVFRRGTAVALIDFDFAAPGRPMWDLAMTARYWVPMLDPVSAAVTAREHLDPVARLRFLVDEYGLRTEERTEIVSVINEANAVSQAFVVARVERGEPAFVEAWNQHGGEQRWERIHSWMRQIGDRLTEALVAR